MRSPAPYYPIVVLGGGPAGSAVAAALARAGRRVALFERDTFPRDKLCGEFLSGESRRLLAELGCLDDVLRTGPPAIAAMEFTSPGGARMFAPLPSPALGVSRRTLDATLFTHAAHCGAETFENAEVHGLRTTPTGAEIDVSLCSANGDPGQQTVRAHLVIAAYGRVSRLDRSLDHAPTGATGTNGFVGFKRHHRPAPGPAGDQAFEQLARRGEMHSFRGGYCGVTLVEGGFINVCLLLRARVLKEIAPSGRWEELSQSLGRLSPALSRRLETLVPCPGRPTLTVSPVPFTSRPKAVGTVLFVGDAAGMIAPLCGDGQAMALDSAARLARLLLSVPERSLVDETSNLAESWSRTWNSGYGYRVILGRWLQHLAFEPRLAGPALRVFSTLPGMPGLLARATRGV